MAQLFRRTITLTGSLLHDALALGLVVGIVNTLSHPCLAAQVTLAFEAQIASILSSKGGTNLPFNASVGDTLAATFTFDPASGGPLYPQPGTMQFVLGGETLKIAGFQIAVRNDYSPNQIPLTGSIADPANTPIVDQGPGISDHISLTCLTQGVFNCGTIPSHSELAYRPTVVLAGLADILSSQDLTANVAAWNSFTFREMSLSFVDLDTNGETYLGAYIGPLHAIPEPGTQFMVAGVIGASLRNLRCRRRGRLHARWPRRPRRVIDASVACVEAQLAVTPMQADVLTRTTHREYRGHREILKFSSASL